MTIHRFLIADSQIDPAGGVLRLVVPEQVKQIGRVLRLGAGDRIDVVDESGTVYRVKLTRVSGDAVQGEIVSVKRSVSEKAVSLTVMLPLLKGGNFEAALAKLTEIGVDKIIPVTTQRTVVKLNEENASEKMRRWMSIIKESTEQCERERPPQMVNVRSFEKALNDLRSADKTPTTFICAERSQAPHLVTIVCRNSSGEASPAIPLSDICIVIGPEGGFTSPEMDLAISLGCIPCRLGDNILRSETAAIVAAALAASFGEILSSESKYKLDT